LDRQGEVAGGGHDGHPPYIRDALLPSPAND
jgi:hypothetical protein